MKKLAPLIAAAFVAGFVAGSVQAEESSEEIATLQIDQGSVLDSTGGEFQTSANGLRLIEGHRLMLVEGSTATVKFDNDCDRKYEEPGVYEIRNDCVALLLNDKAAAVASAGSSKTGTIVASTVGGVAVAYLLYKDHHDDDDDAVPPPISR